MSIEQIKAQVAEWELNFETYYNDWGDMDDNHQENKARIFNQAPAMFQAVKQLMAENERLNTDIEILKTDVALHSDAHLQALRKIEDLKVSKGNGTWGSVTGALISQPE